MALAQEEVFGPVLAVMVVAGFDEAVAVANETRFGLSSSVYTRSLERALRFVEETDVGLTHVNIATAMKEPMLPFSGVKASGFGIPEAGYSGIEFCTKHKAVYVRYR
jgi:alpha-ketoglutaric semialdehyde dehydrogenase